MYSSTVFMYLIQEHKYIFQVTLYINKSLQQTVSITLHLFVYHMQQKKSTVDITIPKILCNPPREAIA